MKKSTWGALLIVFIGTVAVLAWKFAKPLFWSSVRLAPQTLPINAAPYASAAIITWAIGS